MTHFRFWFCCLVFLTTLTACVGKTYVTLKDSGKVAEELATQYEAEAVELHRGTMLKDGERLEFTMITLKNSGLEFSAPTVDILAIAQNVYVNVPASQDVDFFEVNIIQETGDIISTKEQQTYTFTMKQLAN